MRVEVNKKQQQVIAHFPLFLSTRARWAESPRPITAERVQELNKALEDKYQQLWEKYTDEGSHTVHTRQLHLCSRIPLAAKRYVAENYEQMVMQALQGGHDPDDQDHDEEADAPSLQQPWMRLQDPR